MGSSKNIKGQLHEVIQNIQRTDTEFAAALRKWHQFICSCVFKVATALRLEEEDVLQDFLLDLTKSNLEYKKQFYRYRRRLYEVDRRDGSIVRLSSNPFNTKFHHKVWIPTKNADLIKKSSLQSYLYWRTKQYQADCINLGFIKRNGYEVSYAERTVVVHDASCKKTKKKRVKNVTRTVHLVSSEERINSQRLQTVGDTLESSYPSPLLQYEERRMFEEAKVLSHSAQIIFRQLMFDPAIKDHVLARLAGCSSRKIRIAKGEIERQFIAKREVPVRSRYYFDGLDFSKVAKRDSQILLALPSGRQIWADSDDVVVRPSGIKPVYLKASEVR